MNKIKELYSYRQMIFGLVHRELRGRYKGSVLGFLWTFLNPLLQLFVYTIVFNYIFPSGIEQYYIFLFVGLVPWIFFSTCLSAGCNCILMSGNMVTKIYFPREVLPVSFVFSAFVNMLYCFIVIFAVILFSGLGFNPVAILCLPVIFIVELFLCIGITLLFSALTVYVRDFAHIIGILTMLLQFLTPVMYPLSRITNNTKVPDNLLRIYLLNPMVSILECYRQILYFKTIPDMSTLLGAVLFGVIFLFAGEIVFSKLQKGFAEEL